MAIISLTHNFIFLHIPKTAGSSVRHALSPYQTNKPESPEEWHEDLKDTKHRLSNDFFESAFKFTFIRNPWDRMYSSYQFICNKPLNRVENIPQQYYKSIGFKRWLMEESFFVPNNIPPTSTMIPIQRKNLVDWIYKDGRCLVDYVGRIETISDDFTHIVNKLNITKPKLSHTARSPRKKDYREAYDQEMIDFVSTHHARDIVQFEYSFE